MLQKMLCTLLLSAVLLANANSDTRFSTATTITEVKHNESLHTGTSNASPVFELNKLGANKIINDGSFTPSDSIYKFRNAVKSDTPRPGKSTEISTKESATFVKHGNEEVFDKIIVDNVDFIIELLDGLILNCFICSFFPQMFKNYRRKSVVGLSFNWVFFNMCAYMLGVLFNASMFYVPAIEEQFATKYPGSPFPVLETDVMYSGLGVCTTLVIIMQCLIYKRGNQKLCRELVLLVLNSLIAVGILGVANFNFTSGLDVLYLLSFYQLLLSVQKYISQIHLNYLKKSTQGWSIYGVVLDVLAGLLSIQCLLLDIYAYGGTSIIIKPPAKVGLSFISVFFDLILIYQHCILYNPKLKKNGNLNKKILKINKLNPLRTRPTEMLLKDEDFERLKG